MTPPLPPSLSIHDILANAPEVVNRYMVLPHAMERTSEIEDPCSRVAVCPLRNTSHVRCELRPRLALALFRSRLFLPASGLLFRSRLLRFLIGWGLFPGLRLLNDLAP